MSIRPSAVRTRLLACLFACLLAGLGSVGSGLASPASAAAPAPEPHPAHHRHVIVVGLSGLRWSDVSPSATPALWRLAGQGSVGDLVDYAVLPLTCPADAWLTLNAGARAKTGHTNVTCGAYPLITVAGTGAQVPGLPALESYNQQFHNDPHWGLLAREVPGCATAVGPGGALALAGRDGKVASYLPSPAKITAAALARCPLTVVDLGVLGSSGRAGALAAADAQLARILAAAPAGATVLVTAPGAASKPPHLQVALVSGPGYRAGTLDAASTRQPGLVVLTDLNPTVLGWLGGTSPVDAVGSAVTRGDRGSLSSAIEAMTSRDTAEQVWKSSHNAFFWTYSLADAVALAAIGLVFWGATTERRRKRARWWRVAGVFAAAVPVGTFLANLAPWSSSSHPALVLYTVSAAIALVVALVALTSLRPLFGRERDPLDALGWVCLLTLVVLAVDVMTGSGLQMETPFGLSVLEAGRFYGIGNEALGIYGISGLATAGWLAIGLRRRYPSSRRPALLAVAAVGVFAVFASGWPGFGGKVGGTIAMVPCFLLLALAVAGVRLTWRLVLLVAVSGLALFAVFALVNYLVPATGKSDIGAFAGSSLHGNSGGLLLRKINSNIGSLSVNAFSPLIPLVVVLTGLMLWRPSWFRLTTLPQAYSAAPPAGPLARPLLWVLWLMPVLGWLADDSGVIVPAAALPFALPLGIALAATAAYQDHQARYLETTAPSVSPVTRK